MRRAVAALLGVLVAGAAAGSAAAQVEHTTFTNVSRGVSAIWMQEKGDQVTYYGLSVYELVAEKAARPHGYETRYSVAVCERLKGGSLDCDYPVSARPKVAAFQMDPLLLTAQAVVELPGRSAEITWRGGDTRGSPARTYSWQHVYPPGEIEAFTSASGSLIREAVATGDLFGRSMDQSASAEMAQYASVQNSVCVGLSVCY